MTLHLIATLILRIIVLLVLSVLQLHRVDTTIRMAACTRGAILLLSILLELVWHVAVRTVSDAAAGLSKISVLIIRTLREIL